LTKEAQTAQRAGTTWRRSGSGTALSSFVAFLHATSKIQFGAPAGRAAEVAREAPESALAEAGAVAAVEEEREEWEEQEE
jgi:hypothetical protein